MLKEFKSFILRGNVFDLAVGVIIGAAFTAIVNSIVSNLITPIIAIFTGSVSLSSLSFTIGKAVFKYGAVLDSIINFLITGFVLFLIVKSINKFMNKNKEEAKVTTELDVLTDIRALLEKQTK
jgi:large conductance mechanosensitive channel